MRRNCPKLSPFVTWVYGTPSVLLVKTSGFTTQRIASQRGVRQGCPLSPFLFSLAWRTVLVELAEVLQPRVVAGIGLAPPGGVAGTPGRDAGKCYLPADLANACIDKSVSTNLPSVPRTSSANRSRALFARDGTVYTGIVPSRTFNLSEGHGASQETLPEHGTLRAAAQKSTTHTKRC